MQLAPIASAPARAPEGSHLGGVGTLIATGHWMAPHGSPTYTAGWWTAGSTLGVWTTQTAALEGARLLSENATGPIAVTLSHGSGDQPFVLYRAYRVATSEPTEGPDGWANQPDQWLTSDMLRAPQFRGWTMNAFALAGIADHGQVLPAGRRD